MINKQASSFQYFHLPASILNYLQFPLVSHTMHQYIFLLRVKNIN